MINTIIVNGEKYMLKADVVNISYTTDELQWLKLKYVANIVVRHKDRLLFLESFIDI